MKLPNIKDSEIFKTPRERKDCLQRKNSRLVNGGKKKMSKECRLKHLHGLLYPAELVFNNWDKIDIKKKKTTSQNFSIRVEGSQKNFLMETGKWKGEWNNSSNCCVCARKTTVRVALNSVNLIGKTYICGHLKLSKQKNKLFQVEKEKE